METTYAENFTVAALLVSQLDGFAGAAELHLGDALPDGRRPARPDANEAAAALVAIAGLLFQFAPLMSEDALVPSRARLAALTARFSKTFPDHVLKLPGELAPREPQASANKPAGQPAGSGPLPGVGLPSKRSSGLLFPKTGPLNVAAPNLTLSTGPAIEFSVAALVIAALETYGSAALLHLGEAIAGGARLREPDPQEAWRAILGGTALLNAFAPMMDEMVLIPYEGGFRALIERFAAKYPTVEVFLPDWAIAVYEEIAEGPVASLTGIVDAAFKARRSS